MFYRVHPWIDGVSPAEPGHPFYVFPRQGGGRIDNVDSYSTLYVSDAPAGAVAEAWGNFAEWSDALVEGPPNLPGSVRAISSFEGAPEVSNLDDPSFLLEIGIRPSRVVTRNLRATQAWALAIFTSYGGDGIRWWSYHDPDWGSLGLWSTSLLSYVGTEPLHSRHTAVIEAGHVLSRRWV